MRMSVWLIKRIAPDNSDYLEEAYTSIEAATAICENKSTNFISYSSEEYRGELIKSINSIIVNGRVYKLSELSLNEIHKKIAIEKLSSEEKRAMNLFL